MKKFIALIAVILISVGVVQARDTYSTDSSVLPQVARQFLKKHFKASVNHIKIDKSVIGGTDYEVVLNDGTELDFNSDGNIKEIDGGRNGIPQSVLLKSIVTYISRNYKGAKVVKLDVNRNDYEVELCNGIYLKFDRAGNFLRVDD